jgi:ParB-like chromosome segregation protein Spo0J
MSYDPEKMYPHPTKDIPASFIGEKEIPLSLLIIPDLSDCDLSSLLEDMRINGLKKPIHLSFKRTNEGKYAVADGNKRAFCAKRLKWLTIRAVCIS